MIDTRINLLHFLNTIKETDENHPLTVKQISEKLLKAEVKADAESIKLDINLLIEFGYDIKSPENDNQKYYFGKRDFEDWEIKVLIDAICQAKFLNEQCSKSIIGKLKNMACFDSRKMLDAITPIESYSKCVDTSTEESIISILSAIRKQKQIEFQYTYTDENKNRVFRKEGKLYKVNPYRFVWQDDRYYLMCNYYKFEDISYYRVDKIENVSILDEPVKPLTEIVGANADLKVKDYVSESIYRFTGEQIELTIRVNMQVFDEIIDYFGRNVKIEPTDDLYYVTVKVMESEGLYYWLLQHGESIEVIKPQSVREKFTEKLEKIYNQHRIGVDYEMLKNKKNKPPRRTQKFKKILVFGDLKFRKPDIAELVKDFGLDFD